MNRKLEQAKNHIALVETKETSSDNVITFYVDKKVKTRQAKSAICHSSLAIKRFENPRCQHKGQAQPKSFQNPIYDNKTHASLASLLK